MKLLTYNIHKGFSAFGGKLVLKQMKTAFERVAPDLVLLQEIHGEHRRHRDRVEDWPMQPQLEFFADRLWGHYAYGKNAIYEDGDHGNAILSKLPFVRWENQNVSDYSWASRSILHGVILDPKQANAKHVHVVCVHFGLLFSERGRQLESLAERIRREVAPGEPLIVAGDFNDWNEKADAFLSHKMGMRDAFFAIHGRRARTFPAYLPVLPTDRIYIRDLDVVSAQVLRGDPWNRLSDHLPILAEFSLSNRA